MQPNGKRKIFLILVFLLLVGFIGCFFIPKLDRIAWRVISIGEFKTLKILSIFSTKPYSKPVGSEVNLASHRGVFSETVVGNSEKSILSAAKNSFRYIEIDVSFSKDYIPFVFHDSNFKFKTKLDRLTSKVFWEDVQKLKLSDGQRIINLKLFFSDYAGLFEGIILDVKTENNYFSEKAHSFINVINNSDFSKEIYVIGRSCGVLSMIKKLNPKLKVGCEDQGVLYNYITGKDLISLHYYSQFSYVEYYLAKKLNLTTILWTINKPQDLQNLRNLANTIILTDFQNPQY
jgi:glycerophosphoryl diester phosphodiesterase